MSNFDQLKADLIAGGWSIERAEEVARKAAALPPARRFEALFSAEKLAAPPQRREVFEYVQVIVEEAAAYMKREFAAAKERFQSIEQKLTEIEQRGVKYCGVHQRALNYAMGSIVTHDGQGWVALRAVEPGEEPGASKGWQLFIQKGRNGKDLR